ncbi:hypothetical protein TcWFU_007238 [Taenia crassiceps]|uniref:Secreted protein n=1 Tax=Taenia crassiceps TaxID=6207 RepID=A0ABR4Q8J1_9CEST
MGHFFVHPIYLLLPAFFLIANCEQRVILLCKWANNGLSQVSPKSLQCRNISNRSSHLSYRVMEVSIEMGGVYRLCSELVSMQENLLVVSSLDKGDTLVNSTSTSRLPLRVHEVWLVIAKR